jgi:hypothetical protein
MLLVTFPPAGLATRRIISPAERDRERHPIDGAQRADN